MASATQQYLQVHPENDSLSPLPAQYRHGLVAIAVFALLSFVITSALFLYLTFKLVSWSLKNTARTNSIKSNVPDPQPITDFTYENGAYGPEGESSKVAHDRSVRRIQEAGRRPPNQFLVLIYNLIIADMHQAAAFILTISWLRGGGIIINTPTCFVQGFLASNGNLSSSLFMTTIAVHTYFSVVKGSQPTQTVLYFGIFAIWVFVYLMCVVPLVATHNGRDVGGYFVRADPWCWINDDYNNIQLLTHNLFVFVSMFATTALYVAIYLSLREEVRSKLQRPGQNMANIKLSHKPAFLLYPLIYVICTLPLVLARIVDMAGVEVPIEYYCFTGAIIASNGSFDCALFGTTRHTIVFGATDDVNAGNTGLDTFAFMRTPPSQFGNAVWIEGGEGPRENTDVGGWWRRLGRRRRSSAMTIPTHTRPLSQESLRGEPQQDMAIQMDVVTTMTIEIDEGKQRDTRSPSSLRSDTPSLFGGEKHVFKGL
ncbi:G protein-coupled glucose receptor regulating Gpa2-domain-containing protein [Dactylonectria estremocensis]|uniref:G protein-coupled glucose receptor regulating Gpa2-domain-containing protein n=1 Tax=Dactylonectria estremocensis TaxID=1079267 RepID=A0A9P9FHM2_9HYPO|nr:G protein-coupled glucose receptor regulating Gpa2-domain-containing protein [Dactylonectria estremocensis]